MIKSYKILDPAQFRVLKVFLFRDPITRLYAYVYYLRPLTATYNKSVTDDFDNQFYHWLISMNLEQVQQIFSEDIYYEGQLELELKKFTSNMVENVMCLRCHGNYTFDEIKQKGGIDAADINLKVFWRATKADFVLTQGGVFTFDKNKEQYFFDVFNSITIE